MVLQKFCPDCGQIKASSEFYKNKNNYTDGLGTYCKACTLIRQKKYANQHKAERSAYNKVRYERDKEAIKAQARKYNAEHREERRAYDKKRSQTPDRLQWRAEYEEKNKERLRAYRKQYLEATEEQRLAYLARTRDERLRKYNEKYASDPLFRLNQLMSSYIYHSLKKSKNETPWKDLVPYTLDELRIHLESQFDKNMTWENMGEYWEIDHIIPKGTFNMTSAECRDFKICWSLMNLRPLEWRANRQRSKDGSDIPEAIKRKILEQEV